MEQVAISFSRVSSRCRDGTRVFCIGKWILYHWPTREAHPHDLLGTSPLVFRSSLPRLGMSVCYIFEKPVTHLLTALLLACSMQSLLSQAVLPVLQVPPVCEDHSEEKTSGKSTLCSDMIYLTIARKTVQHALRSYHLCLLLITLFWLLSIKKKDDQYCLYYIYLIFLETVDSLLLRVKLLLVPKNAQTTAQLHSSHTLVK